MIRLPRQPSAFSVPNSRTRRDTAAIVSSTATANAAISTRTDSHLPRSLASFAALVSEPVTWLARLLGVVTVARRQQLGISLLHGGDVRGAGRGDVDRVDVVLQAAAAGPVRPATWARAAGCTRCGGLLPCGWVTMPMTVNFVPPTLIVPPVFRPFDVA